MRERIHIMLIITGVFCLVMSCASNHFIQYSEPGAALRQPMTLREAIQKYRRSASMIYGIYELRMDIVYESWEYTGALLVEEAGYYKLEVEQMKARRAVAEEKFKEKESFLVGFYPGMEEWGELDEPNCEWKIYLLIDDSMRLPARKIVKYKMPKAFKDRYFPFFTAWRDIYRVTFDAIDKTNGKRHIDEQTDQIKLLITGPLGELSATWRFGKNKKEIR